MNDAPFEFSVVVTNSNFEEKNVSLRITIVVKMGEATFRFKKKSYPNLRVALRKNKNMVKNTKLC